MYFVFYGLGGYAQLRYLRFGYTRINDGIVTLEQPSDSQTQSIDFTLTILP